MIIIKFKYMETKLPYEKPLTEEVSLSPTGIIAASGEVYSINTYYGVDYGDIWEEDI